MSKLVNGSTTIHKETNKKEISANSETLTPPETSKLLLPIELVKPSETAVTAFKPDVQVSNVVSSEATKTDPAPDTSIAAEAAAAYKELLQNVADPTLT